MPAFLSGIYPIIDADALRGLWLDPNEVAKCLARCANHPIIRRLPHLGSLPEMSAQNPMTVQLRHKGVGVGVGAGEQWRFATTWLAALRRHAPQIQVIVNDRADVALAVQADGVHVGQEDLPPLACRTLLGKNRWIGLSTHSLEEVEAANQIAPLAGVDYIGFGPVFPTNTKRDALPAQGLARLAEVCRISQVPVVAIGGIDLEHLEAIRATGAQAAALISSWTRVDWSQRLHQAVRCWWGE